METERADESLYTGQIVLNGLPSRTEALIVQTEAEISPFLFGLPLASRGEGSGES